MKLVGGDDAALVKCCQKGDLAAFEELYRRYADSMLRLALRLLGRREDAEDAVQVTFLKLHRALGSFGFQARFSTYLYRINLNVCLDMLEKRKREGLRTGEAPNGEPGRAPTRELRLKLEQAIAALPRKMRIAFVLFAVEGLPQAEIAQVMDLTVGAVKAHIFQAKARLRGLLVDPTREAVS